MLARVALFAALSLSSAALAQTDFPAVFVANEGNLEGSVTSMRVEADGSLSFIDRVITGSRSSTSQPCPGCNPYAIDISPNGRFLATNHAAGDLGEQITVYEIAPDGTLAVLEELPLAQGGLTIGWVRDDLLAVAITDLSSNNQLRLYHWEDGILTLVDTEAAGSFFTSMAVHPNGQWIYANDSFANTVRLFEIAGENASLVQSLGIPIYGISLEVSPDGRFLFAAGGISGGGNKFAGYAIDPVDGTLSALPGSPFTSPGASPKGFTFTPDGGSLYVSHGTDATIRAFSVDGSTGVPSSLPYMFDVGLQGTLQGMDTLDGLLFALDDSSAIDGVTGAYSFAVSGDGSFSPIAGSPFVTQGISPNDVVAWAGPGGCNDADIAEPFGVLDLADVQGFVSGFLAQDPAADIAPPAGVWDLADVQAFVLAFNSGCP
jgi:6-phosphogluconolactonase (cycloisomerase 2 family)